MRSRTINTEEVGYICFVCDDAGWTVDLRTAEQKGLTPTQFTNKCPEHDPEEYELIPADKLDEYKKARSEGAPIVWAATLFSVALTRKDFDPNKHIPIDDAEMFYRRTLTLGTK